MILQLSLSRFYLRGDERRLFQAFSEITAIRDIQGLGRDLLVEIEMAVLTQEALRELLALLWRYDIPVAPLREFAAKKKFDWLNDAQGYWHSAMFKTAEPALVTAIQRRAAAPHASHGHVGARSARRAALNAHRPR